MNAVSRTALSFVQILGGVILLTGMVVSGIGLAAFAPSAGLAIAGIFVYLFVNGWAFYAFLRYRQGRQEELLAVLTATAEARMPLASGVDAYIDSRPPSNEFHVAFRWLAFVTLPLYAYARIWLGWRPFDRLLAELAQQLDLGLPLSEALRAVPGVATRPVRLAAAVGEATGQLGPCLRGVDRESWSAAWLEVAPRLIYPLLVLMFVAHLTTFHMVMIFPRYIRIFDEFGQQLPPETQLLATVADTIGDYLPYLLSTMPLSLILISVLLGCPTIRWHTPFIGRLYRWGVQADVLRTLGRLLAVGQNVPQSLRFLSESGDLPEVVRRRVASAAARVNRGLPLDESLHAAGLLPASMAPLVRASERTRSLPTAASELGDLLAGRAFRVVRRLSLLVSPFMIAAVGAVVGFVALGMFMPLITLLGSMAE